jgi:hypothetical protein
VDKLVQRRKKKWIKLPKTKKKVDKVVQRQKKSGQSCPEREKMDRNEIKGKGQNCPIPY